VTEQYAPNIYVSVVLIQGREGPSTGTAPRLADYKVGILPLDVTPSAQLLKISLASTPEQAEPGTDVTYDLQVTDVNDQPVSAEFSLDLVDKAVLSLQPRTPDAIVEAFYGRRALGINTSSGLAVSANLLLLELAQDLDIPQEDMVGQAEADDAMGGVQATGVPAPAAAPAPPMAEEKVVAESEAAEGLSSARGRNEAQVPADVTIREDFSDTAYWNPMIVTDQNGLAEVTLTLPDNLTTWVMRGVGVTNETLVGEATTELVATMPLLIRPVAPRFFVVDDKAQLAASDAGRTDRLCSRPERDKGHLGGEHPGYS
jgi:uncharacterized protein YfaS (alpha-2-macroglobulin family)